METYTLKEGHARTFLFGVARRPGELVYAAPADTLSAHERQTIAEHFTRVGGPPQPQDGPQAQAGTEKPAQAPALPAAKTLRNGLTEEQARAKLENAGIMFADSVSGDELNDLFAHAFGGAETAGGTPKAAGGTPKAAGGTPKKS